MLYNILLYDMVLLCNLNNRLFIINILTVCAELLKFLHVNTCKCINYDYKVKYDKT